MTDAIEPVRGVAEIRMPPHPRIASAWTLEPSRAAGTHFVAPDTRVDIVVRIDPSARADAFVFGPELKASRHKFDAGTRYLGIRLLTTAGASLFGVDAAALLGSGFPLATWATRDADEVLEKLRRLLDRLASNDRTSSPSWLADVVEFAEAHATLSVDALARATGVTTRSLSRIFARWIGPSPKQMLRLFRARGATRALALGRAPAEVAAELRYADQAHLTRDLRAFFGTTPGAVRRRPRLSDLFNPGAPPSTKIVP